MYLNRLIKIQLWNPYIPIISSAALKSVQKHADKPAETVNGYFQGW